ncbi:MAG: hypothetical protein JXQ83_02575 [Candidatus Glassbacteria bacterium]|nr:hypothetical protein [Candidatus Glassbacteria bacterium]
MQTTLRIKPHHFLDIIRDFGEGREHGPHPYGHLVHVAARTIREHPETVLELTAEPDEICLPCRFLVDGNCIDVTQSPGHLIPKDRWNRLIDGRIFERLGLKEGDRLTALEFCRLARERLGDLYSLYAEADRDKTTRRRGLLESGFAIYLGE